MLANGRKVIGLRRSNRQHPLVKYRYLATSSQPYGRPVNFREFVATIHFNLSKTITQVYVARIAFCLLKLVAKCLAKSSRFELGEDC